ncbi:DUF1905 domain-containing protein [Catenuloplanes japonicus]|uniref:DUF1905 domain-containing protein n=1 Tax=Catenuloplanes japonicus TaxID=33876 RepID=UPI000526CCA8|nr:DUF1905 domain-containing protein [Catenuloplanes japonicus]
MELEFSGEMWFWRGPAPWHFVTVPDEEAAVLRSTAAEVSYGWGMIPAEVHIGATVWETALWPKDGRYIVPIKTTVRRAEELTVGDVITLRLSVACEAPLR